MAEERPSVTSEDLRLYMPLVRAVVAHVICNMPPNVTREDLLAAGSYGLLDALQRDTARGPAFESYARIRIRGAIVDELRSTDWLSRRTRSRLGKTEQVARPDDLLEETRDNSPLPDALIEKKRWDAHVERAVRRLPKREASIVMWHYFEGTTMLEIASRLGVSEPRASQLHMRALGHLRRVLPSTEP